MKKSLTLALISILCFNFCSNHSEQNISEKPAISQADGSLTDNINPVIIKGILYDHNKSPLPMANIQVNKINATQGKSFGAATNFDGEYLLRIPMQSYNIKIMMILTYSAYKPDTTIFQVTSGDTLHMTHQFELN